MSVATMKPSITELRIKAAVGFGLSITSLNFIVIVFVYRSGLSFDLSNAVMTITTLMVYGIPVSMAVTALVFAKEAESLMESPYIAFRKLAYGFSIASLIIFGTILTVLFFIALFSGNLRVFQDARIFI